MIDKEKIPEPTYKELCELMGKEAAEKFIIDNNYNYQAIQRKILLLNLKPTVNKIEKKASEGEKFLSVKKVFYFIIFIILLFLIIFIYFPRIVENLS